VNIKANEFDRVVNKLAMQTRATGDLHAWLEYEGQVVVRTKRSHCKGDIPCPDKVRNQLKVDETQMRGLIDCGFSREDYIEHLKRRGIIASAPASVNTASQLPEGADRPVARPVPAPAPWQKRP